MFMINDAIKVEHYCQFARICGPPPLFLRNNCETNDRFMNVKAILAGMTEVSL